MNNELYFLRTQVAKALSHPLRMEIIDTLKPDEEKCVCELVAKLGYAQPVISKHLAIMKNAGLITARKEGTKTFYKLRTPCVKEFLGCIDAVLKHDLEMKKKNLAELKLI